MSAFMAAQRVAMAVLEHEDKGERLFRDGPVGGVVPEMIPLLEPQAMRVDLERLFDILKQDPALRQVRFDSRRAIAWLKRVMHERPKTDDEAAAWMDQVAAEFAADGANRKVVEGVIDHLLRAAPRWAEDPEDLRCLAAGIIFASVAMKDTDVNPLTAMLFRLAVDEAIEEADERKWLLDALELDIAQVEDACLSGAPIPSEDLVDAFSQMSSHDQEKLRDIAEQQVDSLRHQIVAEDFQVLLPVPCVLEPLMALLEFFERSAQNNSNDEPGAAWNEELEDLLGESVREELHEEDRRLYSEVCEDWLATKASHFPEQEPLVRTLRQLVLSDSLVTVEDALVLATLTRFRFSTVPGAPEIHLDYTGVDGEDLERYGDYLVQRGYPALALRTYRASEAVRSPSESLKTKIANLTKAVEGGGGGGGAS